jgi:hypothetical protein
MTKFSLISGSAVGAAVLALGTFGLAASAMAASAPNLVSGTVTSISGANITVKGGKAEGDNTFTIVTNASTKFVDVTRAGTSGTRDKTKSTLSDINVGDTLNVSGTATGVFTIDATKVRDVSGTPAIHGQVTAINGSTITIKTDKKNGSVVYTINTSSSTAFFAVSKSISSTGYVTRTKTDSALANVKVGDKVSVHGTVASANIITATKVTDRG